MAGGLDGKRIAFLVAPEGVEQVELTEPWQAVKQAGATPVLVSTKKGKVQAFNHLDKADSFPVDETVDSTPPAEYDGLVLPGGVANPDFLRMNETVPGWVGSFFSAGKPVAVICHGGWTLVEADVVSGRTMTSWPSLQTDLRNAGANWVDKEVVIDRGNDVSRSVLISSRKPDDLKAFCGTLTEEFASA